MGRFAGSSEEEDLDDDANDHDNDDDEKGDDEDIEKVESEVVPTSGRSRAWGGVHGRREQIDASPSGCGRGRR